MTPLTDDTCRITLVLDFVAGKGGGGPLAGCCGGGKAPSPTAIGLLLASHLQRFASPPKANV